MKEFKGTKGQWYLSGSTFVTTTNEDICDVFVHLEAYMDKQNEQQKVKAEANAKLISKAPELLELLNHFVEMSDELSVPDHLIETFANLYANAFNTIQEATTI